MGLHSSSIQNCINGLHLFREIWIWEEPICPKSGMLYSNNSSHAAPEHIYLWIIIEIFYCEETFFLYYFSVYLWCYTGVSSVYQQGPNKSVLVSQATYFSPLRQTFNEEFNRKALKCPALKVNQSCFTPQV